MGIKFVSVKASSPQIRRTGFSNLGRWIIYEKSTKISYKTQKIQIQRIQTKNKKSLSLTRLTNRIFLHTSTKCVRPSETFHTSYLLLSMWSSEKRPVQNTQSASCSSSSVELSAKGTARSVSERVGVSDGVWFSQTLLFRLFGGPRRTFNASQIVLDLVACFIFFFWVASTNFL